MLNNYSFDIDASQLSSEIPDAVNNVNVWYMGSQFINAQKNPDNDIFEFVDYVQLMQCSGGSLERDLFKNPSDTSVLDDYDFSRLIENCRGILALGAKPHLKLGSVPLKFVTSYKISSAFGTNLYPPDDYNVYYNYIAALAQALVNEFSAAEVLTWRFGVMTEYENSDWFMAQSGDPVESAVAYCKLYDYTVAALCDIIGDSVFVGAHSMSVSEGLWDEAVFINHCASGTNYKTGEKGTRLCFLSASFYDNKPGKFSSGKTLPETVAYLRDTAEKAGLTDLIYGVDEGRILSGNVSGTDSDALNSRICGYTYQAAYDARLIKQCVDNNISYFSTWSFLSGGLLCGNPTVSYHTAKCFSGFEGSRLAQTEKSTGGFIPNAEVEALAGYNESTDTLRVMLYNFKNDLAYDADTDVSFSINAPRFGDRTVNVTVYTVDDDCNFFDEWCEDRKTYGINDDCFAWSPDDPTLDSTTTLHNPDAIQLYKNQLFNKYTDCSRLTPETYTADTENGTIKINITVKPNTVVFYQITPVE